MDITRPLNVTLNKLNAAGLHISQHPKAPQANEWYVGFAPHGSELGPYRTPEAALFAGIRWFRFLYEEYRDLVMEEE